MIVRRTIETTEALNTPHGVDARKLHSSDHAVVIHLTLQPGESLRPHITPVDVCFYLLEGTGIVRIGDDRQEVSANTLVESPAGIVHRWENHSDAPIRLPVPRLMAYSAPRLIWTHTVSGWSHLLRSVRQAQSVTAMTRAASSMPRASS